MQTLSNQKSLGLRAFFRGVVVLFLCLSFSIEGGAQSEESASPGDVDQYSAVYHLKTSSLPIDETISLVFRYHGYNNVVFVAPHDPVDVAFDLTGKSFEDFLSAIAKQGNLRIERVLGDSIFLIAPPKRFDAIKTQAERNFDIVERAAVFVGPDCEVSFDGMLSIPAGAIMAVIAKKGKKVVKLDQVTEGELGVQGRGYPPPAQALSLAAAIVGCDVYVNKDDELVVTPSNSSAVPEAMPIVQPLEISDPFRVVATIGHDGNSLALIQQGREWVEMQEKRSIEGIWRIQKVRPGAVEIIDERNGRVETHFVQ